MAGRSEYRNGWIAEKLDRINLTVPKGKKDTIKAHAEAQGESVNGFINRAIEETMERDSKSLNCFNDEAVDFEHRGGPADIFIGEKETCFLPDEEKKVAVQAIKEGKKPEKKPSARLSSSDIDLIEKITAGLKNRDKPHVTKEELADDFSRILMNGVNEAKDWLVPRYKEMGPEEIEKITAALEQAEAAIKKMRIWSDRR